VFTPTTEARTTPKLELTEVKGIGEKRAVQLEAMGISNIDDLAEASAEDIAKKLQISLKITKKWIDSAKKLAK
jgi:predicted flap endonuclease-1-like 5' DNA nuclease